MKSSIIQKSVSTIIDWKKKKFLEVNNEYQRGAVWTSRQERLLIDSMMRGYAIPLFYFHFISHVADGLSSQSYEIIDGQQRINAIYKFVSNELRLFNPQKDKRTGMPKFLCEEECSWGGKTFETLTPEDKDRFLDIQLQIVRIESANDNEIRDLFVRLQSGLPLNAQEKRDAWPGKFSEFVKKTAGKPPKIGHDFFRLHMKGIGEKRGGLRQSCAQIYMTFFARQHYGPNAFVNLNSSQIDEFYRHHLDFDQNKSEYLVNRFNITLDVACDVLSNGNRPPIRFHTALHTILFIDTLLDDFAHTWKQRYAIALDSFQKSLAEATKAKDGTSKYWLNYGSLARTNAALKETINRRHEFFVSEMIGFMKPMTRKDPQRLFSNAEREILYFSSGKKCSICEADVSWCDAEAHHRLAHTDGGLTSLDNAELVHRKCHPRGHDSYGQVVPIDSDEEIPWEVQNDVSTRTRVTINDGSVPPYLDNYRRQLDNQNSLMSKILRYMKENEEVNFIDMKRVCVEKFGCKSTTSGSIGACIKVLETDGYIRIENGLAGKMLIYIQQQ